MAKDTHRAGNGILGDIDPAPEPDAPNSGEPVRDREEEERKRDDQPNRKESDGTARSQ